MNVLNIDWLIDSNFVHRTYPATLIILIIDVPTSPETHIQYSCIWCPFSTMSFLVHINMHVSLWRFYLHNPTESILFSLNKHWKYGFLFNLGNRSIIDFTVQGLWNRQVTQLWGIGGPFTPQNILAVVCSWCGFLKQTFIRLY